MSKAYIGLLAALVLTLLRVLVVDIDPPARDLTDYLAKDECFYVYPAYDRFVYDEAFRDTAPRWYGIPVLTNLLAFVGLETFGSNYLGLRIGSVLLAALSLVLFHRLLRFLTRDLWLLNALPLLLCLDASFGFGSIMVEPTMSRMAMMLLMMVMAVRRLERHGPTPLGAVLLCAISVWISLPTYPTNAFVILGVALSALLMEWNTYRSRTRLMSTALAMGLSIALSLALLFGITALLGFKDIEAFQTANEAYRSRVSVSLGAWLQNVQHVPYANFLRLNPALLLGSLMAAAALLTLRGVRWSASAIVVVSFSAALLAQTIFINDYPKRKLLMLLPLALLTIALAWDRLRLVAVPENRRRMLMFLGGMFALATAWQTWAHVKTSVNEASVVMRALWPGIVILGIVLVIAVTTTVARRPLTRWLLILLALPGAVNTADLMIVNRTYAYRHMLEDLQAYGDAGFIGAASMGFRPYNQLRVSLNPYMVPGAYAESWPILSRMAAADSSTNYCIGYLDQAADLAAIGFRPVRVFVLNADETWRERQFIVYKERTELPGERGQSSSLDAESP